VTEGLPSGGDCLDRRKETANHRAGPARLVAAAHSTSHPDSTRNSPVGTLRQCIGEPGQDSRVGRAHVKGGEIGPGNFSFKRLSDLLPRRKTGSVETANPNAPDLQFDGLYIRVYMVYKSNDARHESPHCRRPRGRKHRRDCVCFLGEARLPAANPSASIQGQR
jgi:hypothetical protein